MEVHSKERRKDHERGVTRDFGGAQEITTEANEVIVRLSRTVI